MYEICLASRDLSISMVLSHGCCATSNLCVSKENTKMEDEWTLLIALICKSTCEARVISLVHPRSAPVGPRQRRLSDGRITVGLVVPLLCVTADWELR